MRVWGSTGFLIDNSSGLGFLENHIPSNIKGKWIVKGNSRLLKSKKAAVLLSRQDRSPSTQSWWIHAVFSVTKWAAENGYVFLSGKGITHLDFTRWAAHTNCPNILVDVCKEKDMGSDEWSKCHAFFVPDGRHDKRELYKLRDKLIAGMADVIIAVAVRKGGIMEEITSGLMDANKELYVLSPPESGKAFMGNLDLLERGVKPLELEMNIPDSSPASVKAQTEIAPKRFEDWDKYLWHFTRGCAGPWPGQNMGDYFSELIANAPLANHSAMDTLALILDKGMIKGCSRMIRGGYKVVSFTSLPPHKILESRAYRSALMRWNFEPYGIGIDKNLAVELGLKEVKYGTPDDFKAMSKDEKHLFQVKNSGDLSWTGEGEWRSSGDVNLSELPQDKCVVLVKSEADRKFVEEYTGFRVVGLDNG